MPGIQICARSFHSAHDCLGQPQKSEFFSGRTTKGEGGGKGRNTKKSDFLKLEKISEKMGLGP